MTCPRCGHTVAGDARFCAACGCPTNGADTIAPVRKHICVLFVDLVNSTGLAEATDPELLRILLSRYFERVSHTIWRYGGTVEKFIGDAVVAVFGVPVSREDDALRALRAANDVVAAVSGPVLSKDLSIDHDLAVRVGVNAGEVFVTQQPDGHFSITGDAVNIAARLQSRAEAGQVFVGETVAEIVGHDAQLDYVGHELHRGRSRTEGVYRLVSCDPRGTDERGGELIGRDRELSELTDTADRSAGRRQGWWVTIVGDAGVGKSALVRALVARRSGALVLRASSQPTFMVTKSSLAVVEEVLSGLAGDWAATARELLGPELAASVVMRLESAIGRNDTPTTIPDVAWALARLLTEIARDRPLLLVWEDVHHATEPELELVTTLVMELRQVPALTVCLARPDLFVTRPWWGGGLRSRVDHLEPMSAPDLRALAEAWSGDRAGGGPDLDDLAARSEGNPLVLRLLMDATDDGRRLPAAVHTLYEAALDRLMPAERALCEAGATLGREFPVDGAARLIDLAPEADLAEIVGHLSALNILESATGQGAVRFTQTLFMQTAYASMPKQVRIGRHIRAADWLIDRGPAEAGTDHAVAGHLMRAIDAARQMHGGYAQFEGVRERAVAYGLASLRDQVRRGDPGRNQAARSLAEIMPPADERLIEVVLALWLSRAGATGDRLFREGFAIAETSLAASEAWRAVRLIPQRMDDLGRGHLSAGQALPETRELIETLESTPGRPPAALILAYLFASQVAAEADDLGYCHSIVQRGLAVAEDAGEAGAARIFRSSALQISLASDDPLDVTVRLGELIRRDVEGVRSARPIVHGVLAAAYALRGSHDDAERIWLAAAEPRSAIPAGVRAFVDIYECYLRLAAGRTADAAAAFSELATGAAGAPSLRIELATCAARYHLYAGDIASARRCAATARAYLAEAGASDAPPQFEARLWILDAILDTAGHPAPERAARARELRATQPGPLARGYFDLDTAALLYALGRGEEADGSIRRARGEFTAKGAHALIELVDGWQAALRRLAPEHRNDDVAV